MTRQGALRRGLEASHAQALGPYQAFMSITMGSHVASFPGSTAQHFLHRVFPKCKKRWAVEAGNEARPIVVKQCN